MGHNLMRQSERGKENGARKGKERSANPVEKQRWEKTVLEEKGSLNEK